MWESSADDFVSQCSSVFKVVFFLTTQTFDFITNVQFTLGYTTSHCLLSSIVNVILVMLYSTINDVDRTASVQKGVELCYGVLLLAHLHINTKPFKLHRDIVHTVYITAHSISIYKYIQVYAVHTYIYMYTLHKHVYVVYACIRMRMCTGDTF